MQHRVFMSLFALIAAFGVNADQRPNILLLVAEDLSPRIGAYGDPVAQTPHLDDLARVGTRFTQAFTTAGVCAPSRASLITGQYQISFGAQHMRTSTAPLGSYLARPPKGLRAFPELLRASGYFTFTDRKLDYQFSGILAGSGPVSIWNLDNAPDTAWRQRRPDQPFFGMINFFETHESGVMHPTAEPHSEVHARTQQMRAASGVVAPSITAPATVTLPPYFPDLPEIRADLARHYDNIAMMDARVGRILAALVEDDLWDNTIIIWTSDHGDGLPRAKRELYDSGTHVPMLIKPTTTMSWPFSAAAERLVSFVDLAPSILTWAGVTLPPYLHGQRLDGQERKYVFAARDRIDEVYDRQRSIRGKRYKYIRSYAPDVPGGHPLAYRDNLDMMRALRAAYTRGELKDAEVLWFEPVAQHRLYDLDDDPHELHDVAQQPHMQPILAGLQARLDGFLQDVGDWGERDEAELRRELLTRDGAIPQTPPPQAHTLVGGKLAISHPHDASIVCRASKGAAWNLYDAPYPSDTLPDLQCLAVRYGWQPSPIIQIQAQIK
ncbi:MAG: sulfatase [Pseudomonadota bacterium]